MINVQSFVAGDLKATNVKPRQTSHDGVKIFDVVVFNRGVIARLIHFTADSGHFSLSDPLRYS